MEHQNQYIRQKEPISFVRVLRGGTKVVGCYSTVFGSVGNTSPLLIVDHTPNTIGSRWFSVSINFPKVGQKGRVQWSRKRKAASSSRSRHREYLNTVAKRDRRTNIYSQAYKSETQHLYATW